MNTTEIIECIEKNHKAKKIFLGVFPIDLLPIRKIKRPCSIICNTDSSDQSGTHWVALFLPKIGKIEYFDSFGMKPMNDEIYKFILMNGGQYIHNDKQIQSNNSDTCGKFCIFFILFRTRNLKYRDFINLFTNDKIYNEKFVKYLFNKI